MKSPLVLSVAKSPDTGDRGLHPKCKLNVDIFVCVNTAVYMATRRQKKLLLKIPQKYNFKNTRVKAPLKQDDLTNIKQNTRTYTWRVENTGATHYGRSKKIIPKTNIRQKR